jgi:hypothetical protein
MTTGTLSLMSLTMDALGRNAICSTVDGGGGGRVGPVGILSGPCLSGHIIKESLLPSLLKYKETLTVLAVDDLPVGRRGDASPDGQPHAQLARVAARADLVLADACGLDEWN